MENKVEEKLYLINRRAYLHMVDNITQVDYTIYDKETMRQIFHDQLDMSTVCEQPVMGIFNAARYAVAEDYGIYIVTVEDVPLDILRTLKIVQHDPPLDEYPRPDNLCYMTHMACMGYLKGDLKTFLAHKVALSASNSRLAKFSAWLCLKTQLRTNADKTVSIKRIGSENSFALYGATWQAVVPN